MDELYVDTPQELTRLCARLRDSAWIALDTEFIRDRTYYPQLCLLQVADDNLIACVDPLALSDLNPLLDILYDSSIIKVLHSAQQDLEIFFYLRGEVPSPVFDTQIAAALVGFGAQIGYAALVKTLLDVDLDKSQTRTDWRRRPLDSPQLRYAFDDVRYLRNVYLDLRGQLQQNGRLDRLQEDFARLSDPKTYSLRPEDAWRRIKGARRLRGIQVDVLRNLAAWREERARALNLPRAWVVGNGALLELARRMPEDEKQLRQIRGLESSTIKRYSGILLDLIELARGETRKSLQDQ